jgi:hypothetical protein
LTVSAIAERGPYPARLDGDKAAVMKPFVPIAVVLVMLTAGAVAETAEERQACIGDAFRICGSAIPDRDRVTACMVENKKQLGPACRAVMARYSRHDVAEEQRNAQPVTKSEDVPAGSN